MLQREAPRWLVERLRLETGCEELDILWNPRLKLYDPVRSPGGLLMGWKHNGRRGGWMVVHWQVFPVVHELRGVRLVVDDAVPVPVWKLDGKRLWPLEPGYWLVREMRRADIVTRGTDRLREYRDMQAGVIERAQTQASLSLEGGLEEVRHAFREFVAEHGAPLTDKQEHIAIHRRAEKAAEAYLKDERLEVREHVDA